jgi:hypothetical protein
MLSFLEGRASDRKLRLFIVGCCRGFWGGLRDERSRTAVEIAERFADDKATPEELLAAHSAAYAAVDDCSTFSALSEDQAIAAYLAAAANVDEPAAEEAEPEYVALHAVGYAWDGDLAESERQQTALLRDIFGNPFRPVAVDPSWLTPTVVQLARGVYEDRAFDRLPILADAIHDAGCEDADILGHCRGPGPHARGCWVVDLLLGKE